jgi:hypothetical protein
MAPEHRRFEMEAHEHRAQLLFDDGPLASTVNQTWATEHSRQIADLNDLTAQQLRTEWRRLYRGQPPRLSRDLLIRSIAYRMQELAHGGLSKTTLRKLAALTKELESNGSVTVAPDVRIRAGARLVREWRGRTHTVTVVEDGFEYAGKSYPSLTKIAHTITGAHWSGPRFFGLIRKEACGVEADPVERDRIDG